MFILRLIFCAMFGHFTGKYIGTENIVHFNKAILCAMTVIYVVLGEILIKVTKS